MKALPSFLLFSILTFSSIAYAASLSYREIAKDEFELILKNDLPLEVSQAQSAIYESAVQICDGRNPVFGKYKFESQEPMASEEGTSSYLFIQKINCGGEVEKAPEIKVISLSKDQEKRLKTQASSFTSDFLSAKDQGRYQFAYDMLTPGMQEITNFTTWRQRESGYFSSVGELISRDIWQLTIYNNPVDSPQPGIYIAADYESNYENSPIHCGYVMWYVSNEILSEFRVMREESGNISREILKKISPSDLQNVRKQVGCRAF